MRTFFSFSKSPLPRVKQSGLTLIEVLVSLVIFSIGFLGLVGMQARAIQTSTDAEDRSRAALLANEIVATMWTKNTVNLRGTAELSAWQARVPDLIASGLPNGVGAVTDPDVNNMVEVSITWHSPGHKSTDPDSRYMTQVVLP